MELRVVSAHDSSSCLGPGLGQVAAMGAAAGAKREAGGR